VVRRLLTISAAALACATGCKPDLGVTASFVDAERVLAVRSEPPEAPLGTMVHLVALVASPNGTVEAAPLSWSFCQAPKPLDQNNVVADACLRDPSSLLALGDGPTADGLIPEDACQRFGPDPPPQMAGDPPLRPRDPDVTGGFYQPVRLDGAGDTAIGLTRIECNLPNASVGVQSDFRMRYHANQNPTVGMVTASVDGQPVGFDALPHATPVLFRYTWDPGAAEGYVLYDLTSQTLVDRRESLRVAFYASAGTWTLDRVGRTEDESDSFVENVWTAPETPGTYHLWFVLRDNRGGVAYTASDVTVQ
jgi:hypothetical protein